MVARLALVLLSATLQALVFPPWGWSALAWVALVPLFWALRGLTPLQGALAGFVWGTVAVWGIGYWVPIAFATYYEQPWWFGLLFALAASLVFAGTYGAGFGACAAWCRELVGVAARPFLFAALWVAWELMRARLLTGEPWILFGYALMPQIPVVQVADLGGVYALSFVLVVANCAIADLWGASPRGWDWFRRYGAVGVTLVGVLAYGYARLSTAWPTAPAVPVTIVQGNNDVGHQWREEFYGEGLREYLSMSRDGVRENGSKLLVWPESSITFFLAHEPSYQRAIALMLEATDANLIVGGPHYEDHEDGQEPHFFNSAFYMTSDSRIASRYDKTHLLPFAEYFPLRTIEFLRRRFERVRFFTPGEPGDPLSTALGNVATLICFEGIFPEIVRAQTAREARLLVNLSNDTWLGPRAGPAQHLSMVALRAVENRLWIVRATTSGISAIIDPCGRVVARSTANVPEVLNGTVVPMAVATVYKRFGDVFAYGCLIASVLILVVLRRRRVVGGGSDR